MNILLLKYKTNILILLCLSVAVAYFPVFFHLFSLKNDALVYFLPFRYQVSSAIQSGSFPWWSDNIYLGTPIYSDIQSGSWNPLVWILSLFGKYNMAVLETELSIYLLVAAIGMYKLAGQFSSPPCIRLIIALSYACSGFMTDSGSFIPWMNAAAVLPFLFCFFIRFLEKPGLQHTIPFTLTVFLLLTAGYPSFLVYTGYLLAGILVFLFFRYRKQRLIVRPVLFQLLLFLFFSLLLWCPVIVAWIDFLPYYQRGGTISLSYAQSNPFPPAGIMSMLIPAGVFNEQEWLKTDPGMRNMSIGLFAFILLPLCYRAVIKNRLLRIIALISILSLLISLGSATPVHSWCHQYLPLFNRFRHPGTLRLFTIAGLLLLAIPAFERLLQTEGNDKLPKKLLWTGCCMLAVTTGYAMTQSSSLQSLFSLSGLTKLNKAGFADLILIQGAIQLSFIGTILYSLYKRKRTIIKVIIIGQIIASVWFALPFTFLSKNRVKTIDQSISRITDKAPEPDTIGVMTHADRQFGPDAPALVIPAFYDKQPVVNHDLVSPTISNAYLHFLNDKPLNQLTNGLPWAFVLPDTLLTPAASSIVKNQHPKDEEVSLISKTATRICFRVNTEHPAYLHIFNQYHHRWQAVVNEIPTGIQRAHHAFMAIKVPAGISEAELLYQPGQIQYILNYTSLFTLCGLLLTLIVISVRQKKQHKSSLYKVRVS